MPKRRVGSRQHDVVARANIAVPGTTGQSGFTLVLGADGTDTMYAAGAPRAADDPQKGADMTDDPRNDTRGDTSERMNSQLDTHAATGDGIDTPVEREG